MRRKFYGLIIGLVLVVSFLEVSMRVASWTFNHLNISQINKVIPSNKSKKEITIATLGESTTALSGNAHNTLLTQETSYPVLLEKYLNEKNLPFHFRVLNRGILMGVTSGIVEEFQRNVISEKPDIVITMMGIKDVFDIQNRRYSGVAKNSEFQGSWLANHSSLYRFVLNIKQQVAQKSTTFKKSNSVNSVYDLSSTFIQSNMRFMAVDVGVMTELYPKYSQEKLKNISDNLFLGIYYYRTWQDDKAREIFEKTIAEDNFGFFTYGNLLLERGKISEAENLFKKFVLKFPNSPYGYRELLKLYSAQEKQNEFKEILKTTAKLKIQKTLPVALGIAQTFRTNQDWKLIIQTLSPHCSPEIKYNFQAVSRENISAFTQQFNSNDLMRECLNLIAISYMNTQKYSQAEAVLIKFSKNSPLYFSGHYLLSKLYEMTSRKMEAENSLSQAMLRNKRAGEYFALADYYKKSNDILNYERVFKSLVINFKDTTKNYQILNELVSSYGGKLIVMQYPTFKIEPMMELSGHLKNAFYLSNETIFDNGPRDEFFFEPNHPYNFSHYTYKGSHVLAKHIADEIELAIKEGKI